MTAGSGRYLAGLAVLLLFLLSVRREYEKAQVSLGTVLREGLLQEIEMELYEQFIPMQAMDLVKETKGNWLYRCQLSQILPLWSYTIGQEHRVHLEEESLSFEQVLLAEAEEGYIEISQPTEPDVQEEQTRTETTEEVDETGWEELLQAENQLIIEQQLAESENLTQSAVFVPHTRQVQIDLGSLLQYETLVQSFYTIDANTMAGSDQLDVNKLLAQDMRMDNTGTDPQILIYHTHSQEAFSDSVPGDPTTTIVGVGEHLTEILRDTYGYQVLHHTGEYDVVSRDNAYAESLPAIEQVLTEHPSIQVVIDLHRDSMPEETKLVMDLDGRPTARFMFFNGLSRTRKTGNISYLYNENLEANLSFSFQMQLKAAEYYPGLTRKIYLKGYRYNMHLRPRTLLIELGAQNNTLQEALNACSPLAHILHMVLSGEE